MKVRLTNKNKKGLYLDKMNLYMRTIESSEGLCLGYDNQMRKTFKCKLLIFFNNHIHDQTIKNFQN